ncbi:WhiB family transcriptional regulator [Leekyejoonella antrihumi]|uniref:Transcriptional regulator WhiB n=1 Tax=Leekyejoonella antrihumi TaxID=1660198 RepID=A0A563E2M5_9MICO|nr:WhiB family transcriptional regulator [Leekyejoonella antrihumi]TWP36787.1 WhiB family transcriptional regulator [Leekyejoonella antrihumi]
MTVVQARRQQRWDLRSPADWQEQAACRHENPELFFPISSSGPAEDQTAHAKSICAQCPVREICLQVALGYAEDEGIWGGMTAQERRELLRERAHHASFRA